MRVALVADTHVPSRAAEVPDWVADVIRTADHTVHAGDFDSPQGHFEVSVLAGGALTAVVGNMDPLLDCPRVTTLDAGSVRFVVTHGDGHRTLADYRQHLVELAARHDADVAVAGHTHRVEDVQRDGVRLLNPGSATGADPATEATLMTVDCEDGAVSVTLHRPPRG